MSKSPKKTPATASWRTLMRRADATTNKAEATKLREQAASLRRDERKKTKALSTRHENNLMRDLGGSERAIRDFNRVKAAEAAPERGFSTVTGEDFQRIDSAPGRGEIVGGEVAKLAETLAELARKKGGTDAVQLALEQLMATARYEGQKVAEESSAKDRIAAREAMDAKIVCGFIAEVDMAQQLYSGLPPDMVWNLNSLTVTKIIDALYRAGYTAKGKK